MSTKHSAEPDPRAVPRARTERTGPIHVEIVSVGRDLLRGWTPDRNAPLLASRLSQRGALVHRITVVDDHDKAIANAVREALERQPHLLVTSGGLGPAPDDRTVAGVARGLRLPLVRAAAAKALVEEAYRKMAEDRRAASAGVTRAREKLFLIPIGSEPIPNSRGVAPGLFYRLPGGTALLCLPGRPDEMRAVLDAAEKRLDEVIPRRRVARREVESPTGDESALWALLERLSEEFPAVWVTSRLAGSRRKDTRFIISFETTEATDQAAEELVDRAVRRLLALVSGSP